MHSQSREFEAAFGRPPQFSVWSPGRINLIGDHIDYCGGLVLPMAIDRGTRLAAAVNDTSKVRILSERFSAAPEFDLDDVVAGPRGHWIDYAIGVAISLGARRGVDLYVSDDIAAGGLSSSASFTVGVGLALESSMGHAVTREADLVRLAIAARSAENEFVGVSCGIMDPMSVALGGLIKLDCDKVLAEVVPFGTGDYAIVVMDTAIARTLASSAYNERIRELEALSGMLEVERSGLCRTITMIELEPAMRQLDPLLARRLRHVISEHERVTQAAIALSNGEMQKLGRLMTESHESLRDDYEVSCEGLDLMVSLCLDEPGVLGARMTGAGFGGCAIALVEAAAVSSVIDSVSARYDRQMQVAPNLFEVRPSAGVTVYPA